MQFWKCFGYVLSESSYRYCHYYTKHDKTNSTSGGSHGIASINNNNNSNNCNDATNRRHGIVAAATAGAATIAIVKSDSAVGTMNNSINHRDM